MAAKRASENVKSINARAVADLGAPSNPEMALTWLIETNRARKKSALDWFRRNELPELLRSEILDGLIRQLDDSHYGYEALTLLQKHLKKSELSKIRNLVQSYLNQDPEFRLRQDFTLFRIADLLQYFNETSTLQLLEEAEDFKLKEYVEKMLINVEE